MNRPEGISQSDLIDAMCLTWRHDFGLPFMGDSEGFRSGMSAQERDGLRLQMRQLYEHHIRPAIQSAVEAERSRCMGIALSFIQYGGDTHHGITENPMADVRDVAAAIRNRGN